MHKATFLHSIVDLHLQHKAPHPSCAVRFESTDAIEGFSLCVCVCVYLDAKLPLPHMWSMSALLYNLTTWGCQYHTNLLQILIDPSLPYIK